MAYSQSLAQQIRKILALKLPPQIFEEELEEKKLFGGLAFMIRGKMVLTVSSRKDQLVMVRIGKEMEKQVLPRTGARTTLMRGRPYHGYIDLDIEGQKELPYWIDLALSYNQELTK
ncbi:MULTISPECIES: TfoX/Sxy family protein [Streptococcus]|uniref:TfoX/Sxy family protein n=1 Tax=Streptococcus TaxID=1301 RepID=UPI00025834BC|nr:MULTISPECIES: TfoX/Sxy family protein [Streptococcus]EIC77540.1 hypothetical protein HMPREF1114_1137 [Streptococcus oralis SK100]KZX07887.1 hypothetical protein A4224_07090 [Streptococcus oralis]MCB7107253.1 TfoX/Sxy family protein [Streptococcus oralis]MCQ5169095.1 TfoX/Sxy family protein [Streptococcus oralis]MCY7072867.1 TfoX/Sxy family protein [Streptococcus oralis]